MLNNILKRTMTVAELREALEDYPDETKVFFSYNFGDYGRTTVAQPINDIEESEIEYSDYHQMAKLSEGGKMVLILN
jgi:hypothetical protein